MCFSFLNITYRTCKTKAKILNAVACRSEIEITNWWNWNLWLSTWLPSYNNCIMLGITGSNCLDQYSTVGNVISSATIYLIWNTTTNVFYQEEKWNRLISQQQTNVSHIIWEYLWMCLTVGTSRWLFDDNDAIICMVQSQWLNSQRS